MRPKKVIKPASTKVLQQESTKIEQKLAELKQQVSQRKKQQQMNRTSQQLNLNGFLKSKPNVTYPSNKKLLDYLSEYKLDSMQKYLKEKNITEIEELLKLEEKVIDAWKDVPVAQRIKLRKLIKDKSNQSPKIKRQINTGSTSDQLFQDVRKIQEIVKKREAEKRFVALPGYDQQEEQQQIGDQERQAMINSIMKVFHPRGSIIHKKETPKNTPKKNVHWSRQVEQMEKNHHQQKYPKELSPKLLDIIEEKQQVKIIEPKTVPQIYSKNGHKYCWNCLKIIQEQGIPGSQNADKLYCNQECFEKFQKPLQHAYQILDNMPQQLEQDQIEMIDLTF